jgi:hypothetical protein
MAWASFELAVNLTIWELANVSQQAGACITSQIISPSARFRTLVALVHLRGGTKEHIEALNKFSQKADGLARQRNRIVHDPAYISSEADVSDLTTLEYSRLEITADRKLAFGMQPASIDDLRKIEDKIVDLIQKYKELSSQILSELPTFSSNEFRRSPVIKQD